MRHCFVLFSPSVLLEPVAYCQKATSTATAYCVAIVRVGSLRCIHAIFAYISIIRFRKLAEKQILVGVDGGLDLDEFFTFFQNNRIVQSLHVWYGRKRKRRKVSYYLLIDKIKSLNSRKID
ncbi:hypothetical protein BpHYR1_022806 [Brachionus plicatilis]|uniref:Uncharacterized protein n=1 Tax=Brachionus plicatilis TaxID=10195 RepID=A0A3M7SYF9_BRAPC|nr:hypothetical protein BpHYR1_022806 [Brachionus plicatilis]